MSNSMRQAPAASGTVSNQLNDLGLDLSAYSNADVLIFAFNSANSNAASVQVRFKTDESNYFQWQATTGLGSGYKIVSANRASLTVQGSPSWDSIQSIQVSTTSTSGGAAEIDWDAIRIADNDFTNPEYVMVARRVLPTPFVVEPGAASDVEFKMTVTL